VAEGAAVIGAALIDLKDRAVGLCWRTIEWVVHIGADYIPSVGKGTINLTG
jgi:hypothetical protein